MKEKNERKFDAIKVRLLQFAEHQGIPKVKFYEKISCPQSNFGGRSIESSLSSAKITEILIIFPELSADWLMLGIGDMLRKNNVRNVAVASAPHSNAANGDMKIEAPAELIALIASQQETINRLTQTVDRLTGAQR